MVHMKNRPNRGPVGSISTLGTYVLRPQKLKHSSPRPEKRQAQTCIVLPGHGRRVLDHLPPSELEPLKAPFHILNACCIVMPSNVCICACGGSGDGDGET